MNVSYEILVDKFGQSLIDASELLTEFDACDLVCKRRTLNDILYLVLQSKVADSDIDMAIKNSRLKPSFTPCVMLKKGTALHNLERMAGLPEAELGKVYILLLHLFKIGYQRRFEDEKNNVSKWWYWDLSDKNNIDKILSAGPNL